LRERQGLLLHAHVFSRVNQVPVEIFDLVDSCNYLQPKRNIGNLTVIFGDANEACVGQKSEALKKFLSDPERSD
jgi:hypothetical protein